MLDGRENSRGDRLLIRACAPRQSHDRALFSCAAWRARADPIRSERIDPRAPSVELGKYYCTNAPIVTDRREWAARTKLAVIPVLPDARYLRIDGDVCIVRDDNIRFGHLGPRSLETVQHRVRNFKFEHRLRAIPEIRTVARSPLRIYFVGRQCNSLAATSRNSALYHPIGNQWMELAKGVLAQAL